MVVRRHDVSAVTWSPARAWALSPQGWAQPEGCICDQLLVLLAPELHTQ